MKARKIDLTDYEYKGNKIDVGGNLAAVLFIGLKPEPRESVKLAAIADRLEDDDEIILSTEDYAKLLKACESGLVTVPQRQLVEVFNRVFDAPEVELEEKKE